MAYVYILTNGSETKIGITSDIDKRMATYRTHNPNIIEYKKYEVEDRAYAKQIEDATKAFFKNSTCQKSKEWFEEYPETINKFVFAIFNIKNNKPSHTKATTVIPTNKQSQNTILDNFIGRINNTKLTPNEYKICMMLYSLISNSYSQGDFILSINNKFIAEKTKIDKTNTSRAIKSLCLKQILHKVDGRISIRKEYFLQQIQQ